MKKRTRLIIFTLALLGILPFLAEAQNPTPFDCSNLAYQVSGPANANSTLYSYNVINGTRNSMGQLPSSMNAIGYNTSDNYIWGYDMVNHKVVKIGSNAAIQSYSINNLPQKLFNVGDVFGNGYLLLYLTDDPRYYVVDIDPSRSTYLKLVNPKNNFHKITASPYGVFIPGNNTLHNIADFAYNQTTGKFYGMAIPQTSSSNEPAAYKIITFDPVANTLTGSVPATGPITSEVGLLGSVFTDQNADMLYAFSNISGKYFKINMTTKVSVLMSTSTVGENNDGASCPEAFLTSSISGKVYHDHDGGFVNNTTIHTKVPSGLYANLVSFSTGKVESVSEVHGFGGFGFDDIGAGDYKVVLSTVNGTVGQNPPSPSLPSGWANTGEFNGVINTGNTAPIDGISAVFTLTAGVDVNHITFGIEQPPNADIKSFTVAESAFSNTPPIGFSYITGYKSIAMSSADLTGYPYGGSLSGTDSEDCSGVASCSNTGTGTTFNINNIKSNTKLFYDFGGASSMTILPINTFPTVINDFDFNKFVIYGQDGAGAGGNKIGFTYSITDSAGISSAGKNYRIETTAPLPITLMSFDATVQNNTVQLKWVASSNQNYKGYEIEQTANGRDWSNIGFINSKSKDVNSSAKLTYIFTDNHPNQGVNFYRLKQISNNGKYKYSNVRTVSISHDEDIMVTPNPTKGIITISGLHKGLNKITVRNSMGQVLSTMFTKDEANYSLDLSKFYIGIYYINIKDKNGVISTHKILKN